MSDKKKTKLKIETVQERILTANEMLKYEIAEELGLMEKVKSTGWKSLTAKESGRIGGIMTKRKKLNSQESEK